MDQLEKWQVAVKVDKCKALHIGWSNVRRKYTVNGRTLRSIDVQRGGLENQIHISLQVISR